MTVPTDIKQQQSQKQFQINDELQSQLVTILITDVAVALIHFYYWNSSTELQQTDRHTDRQTD